MKPINQLTEAIIGAAIEVHRELGPGLLESTYEACLQELLLQRGLHADRQKKMALTFHGKRLDCAYRIDLLVENQVVLELKAVTKTEAIHHLQMMTYLKLANCEVGLIINFNVARLTEGIRRVSRPTK